MKHATSRFLRFFLVAALVAAMAGSLMPTKVVGQTAPTAVTVTPSTMNAGATAEFVIAMMGGSYTANVHKVTLKFSHAQVPSSIDRTDISVTSGSDASLLTVAPTIAGSTISFFTPLDDPDTVVISRSAGVRNSNSPTIAAKVTVNEFDSTAYSVKQYLRVSPASAVRNATVSVTGGGFSPGTSGTISLEKDGSTRGTGGTYSVDSSGALTGSFVASAGTAGGGVAQVTDLGTGVKISSNPYSQRASVKPAATEVSLGSTLSIDLIDFAAGSTFMATIAGQRRTSEVKGNKLTLTIAQGEGTGTKRVAITGSDGQTASFLITIVSRSLTVSPSSAVPGQAITVSGSGFAAGTVNLTLEGTQVERGSGIQVNTDGSFLYTGRVPFNADTVGAGTKTWTASAPDNSRAASSAGFTIQARSVTLSPSTANPGATVEVYGAGWGVTTSEDGNENSEVTLTVGTNAVFGPFPISSSGEFQGAITVPADAGVSRITVTATDNNGKLAGDAYGNQSKAATLSVPTGVISVSPNSASTGSVITISGQGFPAQTNLSALTFGDGNALPVPAPATDVEGNFTVTLTVPAAARGGSLAPGAVVITARVGQISGTTSFTIPGPSISLSASSAMPGGTVTVTGANFSAYSNVATINVGQQNQAPTPNPLTDATGNFSAEVLIPALNPGSYTITVRTTAAFTATAPITILSATAGNVVPVEMAFQALTSRGILTLAAAAAPGGTSFGAYVPDLAGNTLVNVEPNGVLILTLNTDARIAVSGQAAVHVAADTPTFFALGSVVSIEVVE